jgi:hypothetical protein
MASKTIDERLIPITQDSAPTTGSTVTVNSNGYVVLFLRPAGTIATLTVTLPGSPSDGDRISISSSQIITALTMNGGTIVNALTTLALGGFAEYTYNSAGSNWFRSG